MYTWELTHGNSERPAPVARAAPGPSRRLPRLWSRLVSVGRLTPDPGTVRGSGPQSAPRPAAARRRPLQDAVGEVLESVVQFGGERVDGRLHHRVHQVLQLLLRHVHVETVSQELHRGGARTEARQLRACDTDGGGQRENLATEGEWGGESLATGEGQRATRADTM